MSDVFEWRIVDEWRRWVTHCRWVTYMSDALYMSDVHEWRIPCVTWLIRTSDKTHSYAWHDSCSWRGTNHLVCVGIYTRSTRDICVWYGSSICVMWWIHMCDTTHSYVWYMSVCSWRRMNRLFCASISTRSCHGQIWVSFAENSLFYRALLQKRPKILRSLRILAIPYCITM